MSDTISQEALEGFRGGFSGDVVAPDDPSYHEVRAVHNGVIDKRPALIARCQNTADIVDAVNLAQDAGLEISIRGGGHNVAGRAVTDGGLMIDVQPMKGIHVDPRTHMARAQAGLTWREYNRATHGFGQATTGGVISTTGIAGLTMGGGVGWLMGKYGMAIDNLKSVEVITADGEVRTASEDDDSDLFWAVRGGGGNFGVASSFEFATHSVSSVFGGIIAFDLPDAAKVFDFYRDFTADNPDELTAFCGLVHAPDGSGHQIVALPICHCGDGADAENAATQVRTAGTPLVDLLGPMPYPIINTLLDDAFPKGARNYWKSAFFKELSDDTVEIMVDCFKRAPSIMSGMVIEHFHGHVTRIPATATAYPHREPGYNLVLTGQWLDPSDDAENIAWVKTTFAALAPHMADAAYVNYLGDDDGDRVRAAYGPNWERLVELKNRYDPDNIFHLNQNINPKS
jgi:FAD/FMN-containing dehydrogenase